MSESDTERRRGAERPSIDGRPSPVADDHGSSEANRDEPASDPSKPNREVTFSRVGAREGFRDCLPIAIGVSGYGVAFGVLAAEAGLSVAESALMSATVLAGAAQLVAVDLWAASASVATIVLATAAVNLRYLLLGATLRPWFADRSPLETYGSVFFTADENWALTMRSFDDVDGRADAAYLLGSGLAIWLLWVAATVAGAVAGDGIGDPARYGLDVVFVAVFVAIGVDLWDGGDELPAWSAAFVGAAITAHALPGQWYLLAGALAGSLVGVYETDSGTRGVGT